MHTGKSVRAALLVAFLLGASQWALAGGELTPQIGTWAIDAEVNGKPGRGFQIDVQNDILVLYFYGYEPTGKSTYWLAAGQIPVGSDELTADLGEYAGGMAFGDPLKNASYLGSRGKVTIRFSSKTRGEICLPAESCKAISAFNFGFENNASALLGYWLVIGGSGQKSYPDGYEFALRRVVASTNPFVSDIAVGETIINVNGTGTLVSLECSRLRDPRPAQYFCRAGSGAEAIEIYVNLERNAFIGKYRDPQSGDLVGGVWGFRYGNLTGRAVMPN